MSNQNLSDMRAPMPSERGDRHAHLDRNGILNATETACKPAAPCTVTAQPPTEVPSLACSRRASQEADAPTSPSSVSRHSAGGGSEERSLSSAEVR